VAFDRVYGVEERYNRPGEEATLLGDYFQEQPRTYQQNLANQWKRLRFWKECQQTTKQSKAAELDSGLVQDKESSLMQPWLPAENASELDS
jgi:hypothetical protein